MQKPGLRLTMRGRIVAAAVSAVLVSVTSAWIGAGVAEATSHAALPEARVTVSAGESLWSVARAADPDADPRAVTQEIIGMNKLSGYVIYPGEQLWVPRG